MSFMPWSGTQNQLVNDKEGSLLLIIPCAFIIFRSFALFLSDDYYYRVGTRNEKSKTRIYEHQLFVFAPLASKDCLDFAAAHFRGPSRSSPVEKMEMLGFKSGYQEVPSVAQEVSDLIDSAGCGKWKNCIFKRCSI